MSALERVLERLSAVRKGENGYRARCPCLGHGQGRGDKDPSLTLDVDDEGNVLLKCFAGCPTEAVVEALGLRMADLFESRNGYGRGGAYTSPITISTNHATSKTTRATSAYPLISYERSVSGQSITSIKRL
jgi:hypothetical protein